MPTFGRELVLMYMLEALAAVLSVWFLLVILLSKVTLSLLEK
jgi:hypothetical protein